MKFNPILVTKWIKRLAIPVCLIGLYVLYQGYWYMVVPEGMDTLPDTYPPGTTCLIQRNPSVMAVGREIFLEVESGAVPLLVRVAKVENGRVFPGIDNPNSRFVSYAKASFPIDRVRGLVITGMVPAPAVPVSRRDQVPSRDK